uniref:hypothetical protein n=1 Tax=Microbulbifer agarilyticus TaxID=260552 RepID=UPI000255B808|nr:hypothetical protein [Microbulbifer agarilyticus]
MQGIKNLRFVLSGVSPFYQDMAETDRGVTRFIYKKIHLKPLRPDPTIELLDGKFKIVVASSENEGESLNIDPDVINRIASISGGHPHLIQLLGSHVVENEYYDADGCIDTKDLVHSLKTICYESRGRDYELLINTMKNESRFDDYYTFIQIAGGQFPSRVDRSLAIEHIDNEAIDWLLSRDIISIDDEEDCYSVVDEFLRIRVILDLQGQAIDEVESEIMINGELSMPGDSYDLLYQNTGRDEENY